MNRSVLIAATAVIALVLWMLSGQLGSGHDQSDTSQSVDVEDSASVERKVTAMKVQTRQQSSQLITREIIVQGQVEPLKIVHLRAETGARVESVMAEKGQRIQQGEVIAVLSTGNRESNLTVAKANRVQAANEYNAARKLQKKGLSSRVNLESLAAKLASARAQVMAAEIELDNVTITAPLDALVDHIEIEAGDFVDRGGNIATLIDNSQLLMTGKVTQQNIADIKQGMPASAKLITGEILQGTVRYVSSMADSASRSFRLEVLIPTPPARAMSGISAEIQIPVETLQAHLISPAILALDSSGELGIKAVDENSEVVFHSIDVVKTESNGAWVVGIPDEVNIITLGQGFVVPGEKVQTVPEPATATTDNKAVEQES